MEQLTQYAAVMLGIMGALAFVINIIVEMTKELPFIKKMPTKAYTMLVSIVVCEVALIIYFAVNGMALLWYYLVAVFFGAFIIAYLALFGWDALSDVYKRYKK